MEEEKEQLRREEDEVDFLMVRHDQEERNPFVMSPSGGHTHPSPQQYFQNGNGYDRLLDAPNGDHLRPQLNPFSNGNALPTRVCLMASRDECEYDNCFVEEGEEEESKSNDTALRNKNRGGGADGSSQPLFRWKNR